MKKLTTTFLLFASLTNTSFASENPIAMTYDLSVGTIGMITSGPTFTTLVAEFENKEEAHANLDEIARYNLNSNKVMSPSLASKINLVMKQTNTEFSIAILVVEEAALTLLGE